MLSELDILRVIARRRLIKGTINLHNLVRELQEKGVLKTKFRFVKYGFGYYSKDLEEALNSLGNLGLVKVSRGSDGIDVYEITDKGLAILESLLQIRNRGPEASSR